VADVITVILQGVDRLSGTADRGAANLARELENLKRTMSETERAEALQNLLNDVKGAMDPEPAKELQRELDRLKGNMSDTGAVDRFLGRLRQVDVSTDASRESLDRFDNAIVDLDRSLTRHRTELVRNEEANRALRRSIRDLGGEVDTVGSKVDILTQRTENMATRLGRAGGGPANLRGELQRLLTSTGRTEDFDRFLARLDTFGAKSKASAQDLKDFERGMQDIRNASRDLAGEWDRLGARARLLATDVATEAENMSGLGDRVRHVRTEHDGLRDGIDAVASGIEETIGALVRYGASWVALRIAQRSSNDESTSFIGTAQNMAQNVFNVLTRASRGFSSSLQGMNILITAGVVLLPVVTVALQALAGTLVAAAGGAVDRRHRCLPDRLHGTDNRDHPGGTVPARAGQGRWWAATD
jgi:chromosome segregation ATPase